MRDLIMSMDPCIKEIDPYIDTIPSLIKPSPEFIEIPGFRKIKDLFEITFGYPSDAPGRSGVMFRNSISILRLRDMNLEWAFIVPHRQICLKSGNI